MSCSAIRSIFVCAVAFLGALCGDALVEGLSNSQLLWHGDYTDRSSADLVPMAIVAGLTAVVVLALLWRHRLGGWKPATRVLVRSASRALSAQAVARLLPVVYALQLLTLFCMESAEQFLVYGHFFGGTLWLGGPIAVSLAAHALLGVLFAFVLARSLTFGADVLAGIVVRILTIFLARSRESIALHIGRSEHHGAHVHLWSTPTGERGPPTAILFRF